LSEWLLSQGALVDALDATPEMIDVARQHAPGARFIISNGRIPGPANSYDVIVSAFVLQYYMVDTDALHGILGDFVRVLRPGGRLLAIEQVTDGNLTHMMPADRGAKALTSDEAYLRAFSRAGLRSLDTKIVRISDSRILHLVTRLGWMSRVPHLPRYIALEARMRARAPLQDGRYVDVLFTGTS
jgi:trans-aconitate methyltransferase